MVTGLPAVLAKRQLRVLRPRDAAAAYAYPRPEVARLAEAGLLHQVARGYYAVVPQDRVGDRTWRPSLEAAAVGIAAAAYGADRVVLMHLSAARLHGATPRALAVAVVAVPEQRPRLELVDRAAAVLFVQRRTELLDAELMSTDLGDALVATIEQTVLDLAHRPDLGGLPVEASSAVQALLPRADAAVLDQLADAHRLRAALLRARAASSLPPERVATAADGSPEVRSR